jgi:hypothetical protein
LLTKLTDNLVVITDGLMRDWINICVLLTEVFAINTTPHEVLLAQIFLRVVLSLADPTVVRMDWTMWFPTVGTDDRMCITADVSTALAFDDVVFTVSLIALCTFRDMLRTNDIATVTARTAVPPAHMATTNTALFEMFITELIVAVTTALHMVDTVSCFTGDARSGMSWAEPLVTVRTLGGINLTNHLVARVAAINMA